jgi:hypothetical protein
VSTPPAVTVDGRSVEQIEAEIRKKFTVSDAGERLQAELDRLIAGRHQREDEMLAAWVQVGDIPEPLARRFKALFFEDSRDEKLALWQQTGEIDEAQAAPFRVLLERDAEDDGDARPHGEVLPPERRIAVRKRQAPIIDGSDCGNGADDAAQAAEPADIGRRDAPPGMRQEPTTIVVFSTHAA